MEMMAWVNDYYQWIKALHVISVISWMAGLLYLPRLFVYHAEAEIGSDKSETFKIMERRLLRGIMNPAMGGVYIFGLLMASAPGHIDWSAGWVWVKVTMIAVLTVMHHLCGLWRKDFLADCNTRSAKYYRVANEVPTLAMVVLVIMVLARPF